tara:strand:- start:794 stop:1669 length:876 start_codon:yes stop_codon:yes gene_type:complete
MRIDRKEFIQELVLREHISRAIRVVQEKRRKEKRSSLKEERQLRALVRQLLVEADADKAPHKSTGINVLEDLLKKIVPVIEQDYKQLTTDPNQRESFRAHVINAVQNTIAPVAASDEGDKEGEEEESAPGDDYEVMGLDEIEVVTGDDAEELEDEEADIEGEDAAEDAFIDIDAGSGEEGDTFGLAGEDQTGRNFAQATFDKIEKQITDAYSLLAADEDKELFYDYLITNLKLYFDKFEDELSSVLPEPTTPEYEDEKDNQEADAEAGEEAEGGDELDLGGDEEGDEELEL